ncbi:cation:proton antiporter [Rhizobium sp. AN80A]|uniref:cation:proton antiporter domain-containing protein n=1 Tax=Rhizobium sp. AN80A TaxID=3040673 RepID=UPI0024B3B367|nr:cation:proton antiporter [Rhizobium sp. AN80A]
MTKHLKFLATLHFLLAFAFLSTGVTAALAAGSDKPAGPSEALFLLQIVVLVVSGRLLGELMVRIGQPSIMGQIIAGVILGPSLFGLLLPDFQARLFPPDEAQKSMSNAIGQLGILFLLLLAGMETDLALARKLRRSATGVSLTGIAIPFAAGFALGQFMPADLLPDPDQRLVASLFLGTALSISSVKIVASVVREMDFMRRNIGQLIVASAIIDDTLGWIIIAVTFGLAKTGTVDPLTLAKSVTGTLAFMVFSFTIGRRIVFEIIRWTNDNFKSDLPVLSAIIAIMGAMAMITNAIGVHTVLGAFVAGILVGESPILTRQIDVQLRGLTTALFMPVFFGLTGLQTDLTVLGDPKIILLTLVVVLIASLGKFGGAFAAAKASGLSNPEALALGCGMNARGSTEVIVATIGLSVGVLNEELFSVIVAMAVITTMAMPPTLRWALARLPLREEEKERLEREDFEKGSFLKQFERAVLVSDGSSNSQLAARIAGLLGASRNMPVTTLDVSSDKDSDATSDGRPGSEGVRDALIPMLEMHASETVRADGEETSALRVTEFAKDVDLESALAEISKSGHDLLFAGVEPVLRSDGSFSPTIQATAEKFARTTAIVSSRGQMPEKSNRLRILVAVSDTQRSVRAAEFAFAVAKASGGHCAVVFVKEERKLQGVSRITDQLSKQADPFRQIDAAAAYFDIKPEKLLRQGSSPELDILRCARSGDYNLIVLGVSRRAGERLSYGNVADALLGTADRSCLLVETEITNIRDDAA